MAKQIKIFWGATIIIAIATTILVFQITSKDELATNSPNEQSILIGGIVPLTEDKSNYGIAVKNAGDIAIEEINKSGGIKNSDLRIVWEDGNCDSKVATKAAQKLINIDKVNIIFGGVCLSETLAIAPLVQTANALLISPSSINSSLYNLGRNVFHTSPNIVELAKVATYYIRDELSISNIAIISEDQEETKEFRDQIVAKFTELGESISSNKAYNTEDLDISDSIKEISENNSELIYIISKTPSFIIDSLNQLEGNTLPILTTEENIYPEMLEAHANKLEGVMSIGRFFDKEKSLAKRLFSSYREIYEQETFDPILVSNIYSQVYLIKEAIEKVGFDIDKLRAHLFELKEWKHALGTLTFDKSGNPVGMSYMVNKVENGELVEIAVFEL